MNLKMLQKNLKADPVGNIILFLFMTLAGGLSVTAVIVAVQLFTAIGGLYETARPPHFLQMHKGEINQEAIDGFNRTYEGITKWQTVEMVNMDGGDIQVKGKETFDLSDCRLDISLVKQNEEYDLLLDGDKKRISLKEGEIGIPVILLQAYDIKPGDLVSLTVEGKQYEFYVREYVYDAQMNSTLCSSTRILLNDDDFANLLKTASEKEYLIEAWFQKSNMGEVYRAAYERAGLAQDGQAVTYSVIILLSALTDIMTAFMIVLASFVLVLAALLCVKYTVMAAVEDELSEIGTMKAIGFLNKDIRELYLLKIRTLGAAGMLSGLIAGGVCAGFFTGHIRQTFGKSPASVMFIIGPVISVILTYEITVLFSKRFLKKLDKITVVDALVTGKGTGMKSYVKDGLHKSRKTELNLLLSIREVVCNFRQYFIVFAGTALAVGMIMIPLNLSNTMGAKEFIPYMGSSVDDIMAEFKKGNEMEAKYQAFKQQLRKDGDVYNYKETRRVRVPASGGDEVMNLYIDCGKEAGTGLKYLEGRAPESDGEIALSKLNADAAGVKINETIFVKVNDINEGFIVCGIYQDVTSGGYTAKSIDSFEGEPTVQYGITVNLKEGIKAVDKALAWSRIMGGGCKIEPMEEYLGQILGGIVRKLKAVSNMMILTGILLTALIVLLFMKLKLLKDKSQIVVLKALGFRNRDVKKQYLFKILLVSILGVLTGISAALLCGERIAGLVMSMMGLGISKITFMINPFMSFLTIPLILLFTAAIAALINLKQIKSYKIIELISET